MADDVDHWRAVPLVEPEQCAFALRLAADRTVTVIVGRQSVAFVVVETVTD
ncbi:MAG: hypothetical protein QM757_45110 [Paludibaculum sp.]